jgi:hypothetical protein
VLIGHKVRDFKTWKAGFDAHAPKRGLTERYLLHSAHDPNEVVGLFELDDLNRARAFCGSADLRQKCARSAPEVRQKCARKCRKSGSWTSRTSISSTTEPRVPAHDPHAARQ